MTMDECSSYMFYMVRALLHNYERLQMIEVDLFALICARIGIGL